MLNYLEQFTSWIVIMVEVVAAIIIAIAALQTFVLTIKLLIRPSDEKHTLRIRLILGKALSLGLELLLGADILETAISPTWNEIGQLAAIAFIRTALNFILEKDLEKFTHSANKLST